MAFPSLGEIHEAVRTGRLQRLPLPTLEEYLEALAVSANVDDQTLTQVRDAVRGELERRQLQPQRLWNAVAGVIGFGCAAIAAVVLLSRCH